MKKVNIVVVNDEFRFKIKNMSMIAGKKRMSILTITNSTRLHNINTYCHERILLQNSKRPISKKKLESFPDWKKWKKKKIEELFRSFALSRNSGLWIQNDLVHFDSFWLLSFIFRFTLCLKLQSPISYSTSKNDVQTQHYFILRWKHWCNKPFLNTTWNLDTLTFLVLRSEVTFYACQPMNHICGLTRVSKPCFIKIMIFMEFNKILNNWTCILARSACASL